MTRICIKLLALAILFTAIASPAMAQQRNASFLNPATAQRPSADGKAGNLPITVAADPAQIDAGETLTNVARRITVFFYNGFRSPVTISNLTLNADGNVRSKVLTDDCKTLKELPVSDRCSIALEVIPNSPGPWTVELLLTHSGQGRIARAEIIGTTLGKADEKSEGLAISKKIAPPLEFGTVRAGEEQATRTMLIENDSNELLLISAIDLIADPTSGLTLRPTGCKASDQLKPGESCPITVIWAPHARGNIATDLIVRHNGNLGFVVVPIRGSAQNNDGDKNDGGTGGTQQVRDFRQPPVRSSNAASLMPQSDNAGVPAPSINNLPLPSARQIANSLPPIQMPRPSAPVVQQPAQGGVGQQASAIDLPLQLIGTVGGRAILGSPQHEPVLIGLGESSQISGVTVELLQLDALRAVVNVDGVRKVLSLRNAPSYIQQGSSNNSTGGAGGGGAAASRTPIAPRIAVPPVETPAAEPQAEAPAPQSPPATPAPSGASAVPNPVTPAELGPLL
jgi:hypothetical protein